MGVSKQAVSKAVKEGRITLFVDPTDNKLKLNADLAAKQWRDNTAPRAENLGIHRAGKNLSGNLDLPEGIDYADAKAEKEFFQARIFELQYKERIKELVSVEEVKRENFKFARMLRDSLQNIPAQICNTIAAETDSFKINNTIMSAINNALEELYRQGFEEIEKENQEAEEQELEVTPEVAEISIEE